jgi:hypothetical protein
MSPGDYMDFGKLLILGLVMLIPITGLTVRFALRPLVEAKARAMAGAAPPELEQRMSRIEAEVERMSELRESLERLTEELEFNRKLALPASDASAAHMRQGA